MSTPKRGIWLCPHHQPKPVMFVTTVWHRPCRLGISQLGYLSSCPTADTQPPPLDIIWQYPDLSQKSFFARQPLAVSPPVGMHWGSATQVEGLHPHVTHF